MKRIFFFFWWLIFLSPWGTTRAAPKSNTTPRLLSKPFAHPQVIVEQQLQQLLIEAYDPDGYDEKLSFSLKKTPSQQALKWFLLPKRRCCVWRALLLWFPRKNTSQKNVQLTVVVTDKAGASDERTFSFEIVSPNQPPRFLSVPSRKVDEGKHYSYKIKVEDPDDLLGKYPIKVELLEAPKGLTFDPVANLLEWTPKAKDVGLHGVVLRAMDWQGAVTIQKFILRVNDLPSRPHFTSIPSLGATLGVPYLYEAKAKDEDQGERIEYSLVKAPKGMKIHRTTGILRWIPRQLGKFSVRLAAMDTTGQKVFQDWTVAVVAKNARPHLTFEPPLILKQGLKLSVVLLLKDPDGDPMSLHLERAPEGCSLKKVSGDKFLLEWRPKAHDVGLHEVCVRLDDGRGGVVRRCHKMRVLDVNDPPFFLSKPIIAVRQGDHYRYWAKAKDPDEGERLTFGLNVAPQGMEIDPATGLVTWWPRSQATVGTHDVQLFVRDSSGVTVLQSYKLKVVDTNDPPKITTRPNQSVVQGQKYHYRVQAMDEDLPSGKKLVYRLLTAPLGMTIDAFSGEIVWTPFNKDVGHHLVVVEVLDERGGVAKQSFFLEVVDKNEPPQVLSKPIRGVMQGEDYRYQIVAMDPDKGDELSFLLESGPRSMELSADGFLSWKASDSSQFLGKVFRIQVRVMDRQGAYTIQAFDLKVFPKHSLPVLKAFPPNKATQGKLYEYQLLLKIPAKRSVIYVLEKGPSGMKLDEKTGKISWRPSFEQVGQHYVQIRVDDQEGGILSIAFSIDVADVNDPPYLISVPSFNLVVGMPFRYKIRIQDPDPADEIVSINLIKAPPKMTLDFQKRLLLWTPAPSDALPAVALHEVTFEVADKKGATARQSFFLHVLPAPSWPSIATKPLLKIPQKRLYQRAFELKDKTNQAVIYNPLVLPSGASLTWRSGLLSWRPDERQLGKHSIALELFTLKGRSALLRYSLEVTDVNDPPRILSSPRRVANVGQVYRYSLKLFDPDTPLSKLSVQLLEKPTSLSPAHELTFDKKRSLVSWVPAAEHRGKIHLVTLFVKDDKGAEALQSFTLEVVDKNHPPLFKKVPLSLVRIDEGEHWSGLVVAKDPDGDELSYRLIKAPEGMLLSSSTGQLFWQPSSSQIGLFTVVVEVGDGHGNFVQHSFQIKVSNRDQAPRFRSVPRTVARQGQPYRYQVKVEEPDGEKVVFRLIYPPRGMTIDAKGLIFWIPNEKQRGRFFIQLKASDSQGNFAIQRFFIEVFPFDRLPRFLSVPPRQVHEGDIYRYLVKGMDPEGQPLNFQLLEAPKGMELRRVDEHSALLLWRPSLRGKSLTSFSVSIQMDDAHTGSVLQNFSIEVIDRNEPPHFISTPCSSAFAGVVYSCVSLRAIDPDKKDFLSFSLVQAPSGLKLESETIYREGRTLGIVSLKWIPKSADIGTHLIVLKVRDARGLQDTMKFSLTVFANQGEPIARTEEDKSGYPDEFILDGTKSQPANGQSLECRWSVERQPSSVQVQIQPIALCKSKVFLRKSGSYVFKLIVGSGKKWSLPAFLRINVLNLPPVASIWAPLGGNTGQPIVLDATESSDANGDSLHFTWSQRNSEPKLQIHLKDPSASKVSFIPKEAGIYHFGLVVKDGFGGSDTAEVKIVVHSPPHFYLPHSIVKAPLFGNVGHPILLDGRRSLNLNDKTLEYRWSILPSTPLDSNLPQKATLSHQYTPTTTFTAEKIGYYRVGLKVKYAGYESLQAIVPLIIEGDDKKDKLPIAQAFSKYATLGELVELNGLASIDFLGGQLTFLWRQSRGRDLIWKSIQQAKPLFLALRGGDYRIQLEVQGRYSKSAPVDLVIRVNEKGNKPPIADAGPDLKGKKSQTAGQLVELDAHLSRDPEGESLSYRWKQVGGFPVFLAYHEKDPKASFTPPIYGIYTFSLEVSDGHVWSLPTLINVVVNDEKNSIPYADAGPDQRVKVGQSVTLDGSRSYDPDATSNEMLSFSWRLIKPRGVDIQLNVADPVHPIFTVQRAGDYLFGLRVDDGLSTSLEDTVLIRAIGQNRVPLAIIKRIDKALYVGDTVVLDGRESKDPDGDPISFHWEQTNGPTLKIENPDSAKISVHFEKKGIYTFQLRVADHFARSEPAEIILKVDERREKEIGCGCRMDYRVSWPLEWIFFFIFVGIWWRRRSEHVKG